MLYPKYQSWYLWGNWLIFQLWSSPERQRPVGVSLEEGHKNDQRNGMFLMRRKAEELELFHMEKAPGRSYWSLWVQRRAIAGFIDLQCTFALQCYMKTPRTEGGTEPGHSHPSHLTLTISGPQAAAKAPCKPLTVNGKPGPLIFLLIGKLDLMWWTSTLYT